MLQNTTTTLVGEFGSLRGGYIHGITYHGRVYASSYYTQSPERYLLHTTKIESRTTLLHLI